MPLDTLIDGLIGGALGGIAQGIVGMMGTMMMGRGLMWPLVLIGYGFRPYTDDPSEDTGTIMRGLLLHMAFTMMLGVVFAFLAPVLPTAIPLWVWGMLYGALIWVIDQLGALRAVDPTMAAKMNQALFLATHLVFGGVLGWYLMAFG